MARTSRTVKRENIGGAEVSTVFLALNHSSFDDGPSVLWETMVFNGSSGEMDRCSGNRADALAMHDRMVERLKRSWGIE